MKSKIVKQIFSVTKAASYRLQQITHQKGMAVQISVERKGCSGLSYKLNLISENQINSNDEVLKTSDGVTLVVESTAIMFLVGTEMDFICNPLGSQFIFNNPNQKNTCGCGKSFTL